MKQPTTTAGPYRVGVTVQPLADGLFQIRCTYCTNEWRERGNEQPKPECACNGGKPVQ